LEISESSYNACLLALSILITIMITTIVIIRTNAVGIDIPSINAKLISPAVTDSSYT